MARISQKNNGKNSNEIGVSDSSILSKKKRTRRSVPRVSPPQRSSIYRGVTRHRWTGRYEAHLWDKNCWNETQNKKGRQVYLGAYDDEEAAAHAYDLAALKYWGQETILNFPLSTYENELKDMEGQSREEYIGSLRRKSSGFSRGVSKYRGVARHHHNGRWEARIGRVFGNKYLYLGTYATQEEAATAYDMAAIEYRGLNAVTNFDLSRYIKWLKPDNQVIKIDNNDSNYQLNTNSTSNLLTPNPIQELGLGNFLETQLQSCNLAKSSSLAHQQRPTTATSALGLLVQSSKFKEMMEMTAAIDDECSLIADDQLESTTSHERCLFPDDIQTFFDCENYNNVYGDQNQHHDTIFGELNSFISPRFQYDFDA